MKTKLVVVTLGLFLSLALFVSGTLAQSILQFPQGEFPLTDFEQSSVNIEEILTGGPPRDGIPSIDKPVFSNLREAEAWLADSEPVVSFSHGGQARAYPLQIMIFHEIVNDTVGGKPVAITFCPLCNASIVFDRAVAGEELDFGTTGRLRNSDLIMYDRQSETWWQQFTGRGIIGKYNEVELEQLPSSIVSFETFKNAYPDGEVLSRDTGVNRQYGQNPYRGYDNIDSNPFLFRGTVDPRLPAMERVLSIPDGEGTQLVAFAALVEEPVVHLMVADEPIVILAATSANSALDQGIIAKARLVPAAAAFRATFNNRALTFVLQEGQVIDEQTQSTWNAFGQATAGELQGAQLQQVDQGVHFAFAWLAFDPDAKVYKPSE